MSFNLSKNQILILKILFENPGKSYYLGEIGKMIGKKPGVFQRAINKLVEADILKSKYRAGSRFFKLNKEYFLYQELRNIILKTVGVQAILKKALKKIKGIKVAFIFGSFAKDKVGASSDIDLMVIGKPDENDLITEISKVEHKLSREINYSIFSIDNLKKGLGEEEVFLEEVVEGPKIFLISNQDELEKITSKRESSKKEI